VLALVVKRATGTGAFVGLLGGMLTVAIFAFHPATRSVSFLWHNPIGVIAVVIIGVAVSLVTRPARAR
jgi:Na+/proline symporter